MSVPICVSHLLRDQSNPSLLTMQSKHASLACMSALRRRLSQSRLRAIGLILVVVYVSAAAISMVVAHVLIVAEAQPVLGERLIAPVARGLEFLDTHWKGVLILVIPFMSFMEKCWVEVQLLMELQLCVHFPAISAGGQPQE